MIKKIYHRNIDSGSTNCQSDLFSFSNFEISSLKLRYVVRLLHVQSRLILFNPFKDVSPKKDSPLWLQRRITLPDIIWAYLEIGGRNAG